MKGRINSIQTLGTVDGPGVRFVLFMQGCPLRCGYCHNPDTWDFAGGYGVTAEEIFEKIKRYREYFGKDGGITVSGGEPCAQADFVRELFALCRSKGIHTALDTSGCIWNEKIEKLLDVTDLCLLDYKMCNAEDYEKYTLCKKSSVDFFLSELQKRSIDTWLRQVIVKGINDSAESVKYLYDVADLHPCVKKVELLKFRKLCAPKYENLGIDFPFGNIPETKNEDLFSLLSAIGKA
ncbi:MAG: pyruvate formate lyase-activating protein [Clostridia bacterium]|nr:pyruvate formate lyase-activating protein [Clostridia bacterium]